MEVEIVPNSDRTFPVKPGKLKKISFKKGRSVAIHEGKLFRGMELKESVTVVVKKFRINGKRRFEARVPGVEQAVSTKKKMRRAIKEMASDMVDEHSWLQFERPTNSILDLPKAILDAKLKPKPPRSKRT